MSSLFLLQLRQIFWQLYALGLMECDIPHRRCDHNKEKKHVFARFEHFECHKPLIS